MSDAKGATPFVSCFGKKKTATAVAHAKEGKGQIRLNGQPISLVQPETLRLKVFEPVLVVGADKFAPVDIRLRVSGGTVKYSSCDMWNPVHVRFSAALDCSCTTAIMKLTSLLLLHNSPICALLVQTVTWNSTW